MIREWQATRLSAIEEGVLRDAQLYRDVLDRTPPKWYTAGKRGLPVWANAALIERRGGDICLITRRLYADKPAVVIELKWDKSAHGAIDLIKERQYVAALAEYKGNLILAGIGYDRKEKTHSCRIEKVVL